jgi:DNA-binding beta-propeller fold protein YncE
VKGDYGDTWALVIGIVLAGAVSFLAWILFFGDLNGKSGGLKQESGKAACVSVDGSGGFSEASEDGECGVARAVGLPTALVLSPDGRNAYVAAHREAVAVLDRDPRSGALAAKDGRTGCVSRDGTPGGERARRLRQPAEAATARTCAVGRGLFGVTDVALSPDGRNAYVGSADGLAILDRDSAGGLRQKAGEQGCITRTGRQRGAQTSTGGCARARGLFDASSVTVSPDGRTVYVTSVDVLAFRRDPQTGALTQVRGRDGCLAATRRGADGADCVADPEIDGATSVVVTPDGRQAYASSGTDAGGTGSVTILDRDRDTGALTPTRASTGCIGQNEGCSVARGLRGAGAIAVSADGANVYVVSFVGCTLVVFDRDAQTGALTQKRGLAGTATKHADSGACSNRRIGDVTGFTGGGVALSPDGRTLFVSARAGLAMYARAPRGGALSYKGCVSDDGEATCEDVKALNIPVSPVVSPRGRNVYVAVQGGDAIAAFDFPRPARSGG